MKKINPFPISGYISPEYFCNRNKETERLLSAINNQRNITLLSLRRMGKTGLIHHVFYKLSNKNDISVFYIDIMPTSNLGDFINKLGETILNKLSPKASAVQKFLKIFSNLRPLITYDAITGRPAVEFKIANKEMGTQSIEQLFEYIQDHNKRIVLAIDEFQQILNYPEKYIEALLRANVQRQQNVNFIFSGSQKHLLLSMFSDHGRPFYQSTETLLLDRINLDKYADFIQTKFVNANKKIERDTILNGIRWADAHTFYVQYLFNKLYSENKNIISIDLLNSVKQEILIEEEVNYYNYRTLLTFHQFGLLIAIAKEHGLEQPTSKSFLNKHNLNTPSSIQRSLKALIDKEMIYKEKGIYKIYDVFFGHWLEWKF